MKSVGFLEEEKAREEHKRLTYNPKQEFKPFKELYIWSILCNKPKMADYLKQRGENPIAKLLVGCKLYQNIKELYDTRMNKNGLIFKQLDNDIRYNFFLPKVLLSIFKQFSNALCLL